MTKRPPGSPSPESPSLGPTGCLLRVLCFFLGPGAMAFSAVVIMQGHGWRLSAADGIYGGIALALIALRFVDVRFLRGRTGTGEPATMRDAIRYAAIVILAGLAIWAAAHGIASYVG